MGWGSSNPLPHPTLTTQMEKLKPREGNRRLTVTQPASCLGSAFWPGCLTHTDLGLNPRSTIHLLYSLSFLGCKMDMIRAPCSLHCGGHIWKTHVAEGPVPPGAPPESQGPLRAINTSCPVGLRIPKPSLHSAHCPEKAGNHARVTQQGPNTLGLELGPVQQSLPPYKWIWQSRGGARACRQPGEGGRQAGSWGWWEEPFLPCL